MEVSQIACNTKYVNQSIKIEQCNDNLNIIELRKQRKKRKILYIYENSQMSCMRVYGKLVIDGFYY
jgi:hypothetical protein